MGLLIFLALMFFLLGDDKRRSTLFGGVAVLGVLLAIASLFAAVVAFPGFFLLGGAGLFFWLKKRKDEKRRKEESGELDYEEIKARWENQKANGTPRYTSQSEYAKNSASNLPKGMDKRKRLVQEFNKKYNLNLTEEDVKRMVDASYMSAAWKQELEAMNRPYESVHEWFAGDTDWLRIYLHAFEVQTVSSDFRLQNKICTESFDEIMKYAESFEHLTLTERIEQVNNKFFTCFDETSFMTVYRFMEEKGMHYDIFKVDLLKNEDELERELERAKAKYKEV